MRTTTVTRPPEHRRRSRQSKPTRHRATRKGSTPAAPRTRRRRSLWRPLWRAVRRPLWRAVRARLRAWCEALVYAWGYRSERWRNRMARAWYRRVASDRALAGPQLGREVARDVAHYLPTWLPQWLRPSRLSAQDGDSGPVPSPSAGKLAMMSGWAGALGVLGLPVAGRALAAVVTGSRPDWLDPTMLPGIVGIGLAASAFLAAHRRRLPWLLLLAGTVSLLLNSRTS